MKKYIKYLLVLMVLVLPLKVFATSVTNVFIDKDNYVSFTGVGDYITYQVETYYGNELVDTFSQRVGTNPTYKMTDRIATGCGMLSEVCPDDLLGNYTLKIYALAYNNGAYDPVESTTSTNTISLKYQFHNGDDYYHVDVVGNETKYTITIDPGDDIQEPQVLGTNYTFGQHVQLGTLASYGYTQQPKVHYFGWPFVEDDFYVFGDATIKYVCEPEFTMSFDFNGGTLNGEGTYSKDSVGYAPSFSLFNIMHAFGADNSPEVVPPVGKEIDYITVDGVTKAVNPEDGFMFNHDTEIKYFWKWKSTTTVRTVTLKDGFGNTIGTIEVADGEKVSQPATPVKGGLLFACWNLGNNCYNFNTAVTENITLDAFWNFNFNVYANMNDVAIFTYSGVEHPNSVGSAGYYNENEIIGIDQRGINGYELKEWRVGSVTGDLVGTDENADYYVANGGHLKIKKTINSSGLKFYAIYEKTKVAVNFVAAGGTAIEPQYVVPGSYATKPNIHASIKEGYLLGDWYTDQALTHKFDFSTPIEDEITLYASWNKYIDEVRGYVGKPFGGFKADTNVVSKDDRYTFEFREWYYTGEGYPRIEGDATFETGKEYEIRYYVIPAKGYAVDYDTEFYLNDEETSTYGSAEARQIRWVAEDPIEVTEFNITGIINPFDGNKFNNSNIKLNTEGLKINETFWTEESTGDRLSETDKFVLGKRYILHVIFNTTYGYVLDENYDENAISGVSGNLKAELVDNFDSYDMQIFYDVLKLSTPKLTLTELKNNTITIDYTVSGQKYEIQRSTNNKTWTKLETVKTNTYTDKSLTYGKTYYYRVKAYANGKWSKYSNVVSKKVVPAKVKNLTIKSVGSNNVKLTYDKVKVTGYVIYYSTNNKDWTKAATVSNADTLEYNVKKLKANKTYYFKVRAYKTVSGEKVYGKYSDVVSVKTAPEKPEVSLSIKTDESMNLKIAASKGAIKYIIEKSMDDKTYEAVSEVTEEGTYVQGEQELGFTYYFRVKVCNVDEKCSGWTKVNLKQTTKTPKFTLETSSKKVTVKITSVTGADGYKIYRSTSKNGKYTMIKEFTEDNGAIEFVDKTKKGTTYYYKVRSYGYRDNGDKEYSPYSSVKSITSK